MDEILYYGESCRDELHVWLHIPPKCDSSSISRTVRGRIRALEWDRPKYDMHWGFGGISRKKCRFRLCEERIVRGARGQIEPKVVLRTVVIETAQLVMLVQSTRIYVQRRQEKP